jgi:hypothetical protein
VTVRSIGQIDDAAGQERQHRDRGNDGAEPARCRSLLDKVASGHGFSSSRSVRLECEPLGRPSIIGKILRKRTCFVAFYPGSKIACSMDAIRWR